MSSYKDYMNHVVMDDPEAQQAAIDKFVKLIDDGETPPRYLLEFVAKLLAGKIEMKQGRPEIKHQNFMLFAAWYAFNCDPDFSHLSKTETGRGAEIGGLLGCTGRTVQRRVEKFGDCWATDIFIIPFFHGKKYYLLTKKEWNDTAQDDMQRNIETYQLRRISRTIGVTA